MSPLVSMAILQLADGRKAQYEQSLLPGCYGSTDFLNFVCSKSVMLNRVDVFGPRIIARSARAQLSSLEICQRLLTLALVELPGVVKPCHQVCGFVPPGEPCGLTCEALRKLRGKGAVAIGRECRLMEPIFLCPLWRSKSGRYFPGLASVSWILTDSCSVFD